MYYIFVKKKKKIVTSFFNYGYTKWVFHNPYETNMNPEYMHVSYKVDFKRFFFFFIMKTFYVIDQLNTGITLVQTC